MSTATTMRGDVKSRVYPEDFDMYLTPLYVTETGLPVRVIVDGCRHGREGRPWEPEIYVKHWEEKEGGFSVSISDDPCVIYGVVTTTSRELEKVFEWVRMNRKALFDYWGTWMGTFDLLDHLRKVK